MAIIQLLFEDNNFSRVVPDQSICFSQAGWRTIFTTTDNILYIVYVPAMNYTFFYETSAYTNTT